ncbi:MAG: aminopeptidase P family protein [Peptoniphilus sp.]|nr:aminopeptidase P family protein [Peptoniphilus sp.]
MILNKIREMMKEQNINAYIIPTLDPHGSEYLPEHFKERKFVTGFSGSQGTALITEEAALLWTDGRYFIQAEKEIKDTGFSLMKMGIEGYPTLNEWLQENLAPNSTVGLNAKYYLQSNYEELEKLLSDKKIKIVDSDLISDLWTDRPALSNSEVFLHDIKYTGLSSEEKIEQVREELSKVKADLTILNGLDDIAWIFNIRANDIKNTPVVISYAVIEQEQAYLFIDSAKLKESVKKELEKFCAIKSYDEIFDHVANYTDKTIYINVNRINRKLYSEIGPSNRIVRGKDISSKLKSIKNKVELENQKNAYIKDGVALAKFTYWIKTQEDISKYNEYEVSEKLLEFRKMQEGFIEPSFDTIAAYGPNAAMMHYTATEKENAQLQSRGFLLVDSGGQYIDGTTDITRTIVLGELTEEEKIDFTYVLKSHLALMGIVFLKGTDDRQLDAITRAPIWKYRYDYKSGTGHGVGYLLGVHETPPTVSMKSAGNEVKVGMIFSNEPGIYKEGKHGIRTENIVEVIEDVKNESGTFLKLNTISYAPIDLEAIDVNYLDEDEIALLNEYHAKVYDKLSPYLSEDEREWLKTNIRKITR